MLTFGLLVCFAVIQGLLGHGYLADPPARSSAWLFDPAFQGCCQYYDHNQMFCGGFYRQWVINGGRCSICGEAADTQPKLFGMGDAKYLGKIVRTYQQGSSIPVTVVLTANHLGTFEFRICSLDENPQQDATQKCLDMNQLTVNNGSKQYPISQTMMTVRVNVNLPADFACDHCVFQWKYRTGNSWGVSASGRGCMGCGKANEEFYGCSDIAIVGQSQSDSQAMLVIPSASTNSTNSIAAPARNCTLAVTFSESFDVVSVMEQYCQSVCSTNCAAENIEGNASRYQGCQDTCAKLCACE